METVVASFRKIRGTSVAFSTKVLNYGIFVGTGQGDRMGGATLLCILAIEAVFVVARATLCISCN